MKIRTHVGIRGHQDAAEAGTRAWHRGSTAPPRTQSENLMYSSHILARIHMKLGTHIDLIELNKFHTACHRLRPTGSRLSCSSKDYFFFNFFFFYFNRPGVFRGLNVLKNSWKFAHTLESAAIRTPQRLGPGRGTGALRRPLEHSQKTWCIAHTYLHVFIWNSVHI